MAELACHFSKLDILGCTGTISSLGQDLVVTEATVGIYIELDYARNIVGDVVRYLSYPECTVRIQTLAAIMSAAEPDSS